MLGDEPNGVTKANPLGDAICHELLRLLARRPAGTCDGILDTDVFTHFLGFEISRWSSRYAGKGLQRPM